MNAIPMIFPNEETSEWGMATLHQFDQKDRSRCGIFSLMTLVLLVLKGTSNEEDE
jgi:hypothetical protein